MTSLSSRTAAVSTVALALVMTAGLLLAWAPSEASAGSCWTRRWLPARYGRLTEISTSRRSTWIFGVAPSETDARPIALLRRGTGWRQTTVPVVGVSGLIGGDARGTGPVWAVGFRRPGESMRPISLRWRDGRWSEVPVPDPPGPGASLADVEILPSGRVWAVGTRLAGGRTWPYAIEYRDGWKRREPTLDVREAGLTAVSSGPAGRLWAVGWRTGTSGTEPWILRRGPSGWTTQPIDELGRGQVVLTDIDVVSERRAWAAGYRMPADSIRFEPLLLVWNGASWSPVTLPWADRVSAVLQGVAASGSGDLLLTGARVARNDGRNRAFAARFVGDVWTRGLAPTSRYHNSELTDGEWLSGRPTLVGVTATQSLYVTACQTSDPTTPTQGASGSRATTTSRRSAPASRSSRVRAGQAPGASPSSARRGARSLVFRDVARQKGIYESSETWGSVAADFDADGWTDIFYGRHNRRTPKLMLGGRRGTFRRVASMALRLRDRHGCAAGDVEADGLPDLFCSIGANRGTNMTSDELWLSIGTRERQQRTADYGVNDPFGRGRVATFFHLDDDPYPELFVGNEPERVDGLPSHDRLYVNDEGRRYLSAPGQGVDRSMGGVCATAGDLDDDGDEDLVVCTSEAWGGLPRGLRVFRNDDGRLQHATQSLGVRPIGDVDAVVADFDGDGKVDDLAQLGAGGLRVSVGGAAGQAPVYRRAVTFGANLAAGDVDGDGRDDLYVQRGGRGNQPDLLLVNRRDGQAWISQRIPQTRVGLADDVVALDHDHNGLDDFFVTNGRMSTGPSQLIAAYRRR